MVSDAYELLHLEDLPWYGQLQDTKDSSEAIAASLDTAELDAVDNFIDETLHRLNMPVDDCESGVWFRYANLDVEAKLALQLDPSRWTLADDREFTRWLFLNAKLGVKWFKGRKSDL